MLCRRCLGIVYMVGFYCRFSCFGIIKVSWIFVSPDSNGLFPCDFMVILNGSYFFSVGCVFKSRNCLPRGDMNSVSTLLGTLYSPFFHVCQSNSVIFRQASCERAQASCVRVARGGHNVIGGIERRM